MYNSCFSRSQAAHSSLPSPPSLAYLAFAVGVFSILNLNFSPASRASEDSLEKVTQSIAREIQGRSQAYSNLKELTAIGPRLSGSSGADQAVQWAQAKMKTYGLDRVWIQPVMVPKWTRGSKETAVLLGEAQNTALQVAALGNSVGTPNGGVTGELVEVQSLQEVARLGRSLQGKIVFYNRPMNPALSDPFEAYGEVVGLRSQGASVAAKYGAVAVLLRSLTLLPDDDHPHTGMLTYRSDSPKIPAAAISTHGANILSQLLKKNSSLRLKLELGSQSYPKVQSYNVIGELKGSEFPEEYVVVGGHLDSWDLGTGAQDDGAGVAQSMEVLRVLKTLGIRPKRTVRTVLFMAEEFGGFGAEEYARQARINGENHVAALESDRGGFSPKGFSCEGNLDALRTVRGWDSYLSPLHANQITSGESGVDVSPLIALGAVAFGFIPDAAHYFDYHHSALDQLEAVNPEDLNAGAAAMAVFTYLAAEKGL